MEWLELGPLTRRWRQSKAEPERSALWARMEELADKGADPFASAHRQDCAFQEAVSSGSLAAIELAARAGRAAGLDIKAGLNAKDCSGNFGRERGPGERQSLLELAWLGGEDEGEEGVVKITRALLALGADPEGLACSPGRPLANAVAMGLIEVAVELIKAGADPTRARPEGGSLLHAALDRREEALGMWEMLIRAGADPAALDAQGRSPWETASDEQRGWLAAWIEREALREESAPAPTGRGSMRV